MRRGTPRPTSIDQNHCDEVLVNWIIGFWWKPARSFASGRGARRKEYSGYFDDEQQSPGVKGPENSARNH